MDQNKSKGYCRQTDREYPLTGVTPPVPLLSLSSCFGSCVSLAAHALALPWYLLVILLQVFPQRILKHEE